MDREKFVQASVRIRNLEKKLLTKIQFERLYEAENLEEAVKHLNETVYSEDLAKIDRAENFEVALSNSLNRTYSEVLKLSPVKELVDILTYKFAFHNIKLAVKEKILQEDFEHIYSKVHYEDLPKLKKQFETEKGEKGTWYEDTVIKAYKVFEDTKDPEKIEFFVDKKYFEKVLEVSKNLGLDLIEEYFKNIKLDAGDQLKEAWATTVQKLGGANLDGASGSEAVRQARMNIDSKIEKPKEREFGDSE